MKFTSLFLGNFFEAGTLSLVPLSFFSAFSSSVGTGSAMISEGDFVDAMLGTITTSTGTTLYSNGSNAYEKTIKELNTTQAYIESLEEQELEDLIAKLENREQEITIQEKTKRK